MEVLIFAVLFSWFKELGLNDRVDRPVGCAVPEEKKNILPILTD